MANENIDFAGDFVLPEIVLHNHKNKGRVQDGDKLGVDIKHMVQEFNIFESMFSGAITGSMVLADTTKHTLKNIKFLYHVFNINT